MKIELEAAQFGLNNKCSYDDIQNLLEFAKGNGISSVCISANNKNAEQVLGQCRIDDLDITTNTIRIDNSLSRNDNFDNFRDEFYKTQKRLDYIELYGLMLSAEDLLSPQGLALWDLATDFKEKEYVYNIGVSVDNTQDLIDVIDTVDIDIVQLPLNLINHKFIGLLPELKRKGIEIHTNSTFLQGLLLLNEYQIPEYFREIKNILTKIPEPKMAYALSFPKLIKEVDKIIIGCYNSQELETIIEMYNYPTENIDYSEFSVTDEKFITPSVINKKCKYM